jgi:hypothetical protein
MSQLNLKTWRLDLVIWITWVNHWKPSCVYMYKNQLKNMLQLYKLHDFYKISFKMKLITYSLNVGHPSPSKKFWAWTWMAPHTHARTHSAHTHTHTHTHTHSLTFNIVWINCVMYEMQQIYNKKIIASGGSGEFIYLRKEYNYFESRSTQQPL